MRRVGGRALRTSILALLLTAALMCGLLALPSLAAVPPLDKEDVIYNYPISPNTTTGVETVEWNDPDENGDDTVGYEHPTTDPYDGYPHGTACDKHVVITKDKVSFNGYGYTSALDYVFTQDRYFNWGNTFTIVPTAMNAHTLADSGYLFNGRITVDTTVTPNKHSYTGYALMLRSHYNGQAPNGTPLGIYLYYIEDEEFLFDNFVVQRRSNDTTIGISNFADNIPNRTLIHRFVPSTYVAGSVPGFPAIPDRDTKQYQLDVTIDPDTRAFTIKVDVLDAAGNPLPDTDDDGVGDGDLPIFEENRPLGPATDTGFGYFTGYYNHSCSTMTRISYDNIKVRVFRIEDLTPAKSTVNFLQEGTTTALCAAVSKSGAADRSFVGGKYKVTPPATLEIGGVTWYLVSTSRGALADGALDNLVYQAADADNVTNVYYARRYTVTEKFLIEGSATQVDATNYPDKVTANVSGGAAFSPAAAPPKTIGDYTYYGYTVNGGAAVTGEPPSVTAVLISSLAGDSTVAYLYKKNVPPPPPPTTTTGGTAIIPLPIPLPAPIVAPIVIPLKIDFCRDKPIEKKCKYETPPKTGDDGIAPAVLLGLCLTVAGTAIIAQRKRRLGK